MLHLLDDRSQSEKAKPFFAYLAYTAPHFPLQCAAEDRDRYRGAYDQGPDALRLQRLASLKAAGIIGEDVEPHAVEAVTAEWEAMTPEERQLSARSMEIYAGMVTAIDREVGKVIEYLTALGELDSEVAEPIGSSLTPDTVIIFHSDNGAEGAAMGELPLHAPKLTTQRPILLWVMTC